MIGIEAGVVSEVINLETSGRQARFIHGRTKSRSNQEGRLAEALRPCHNRPGRGADALEVDPGDEYSMTFSRL